MKSMQRMCVDIDNVVAKSDSVIRNLIGTETSSAVNLNYADIKRFNYWECYTADGKSITREQWNVVHDKFSAAEVVAAIEPAELAVAILTELSADFRIHFVTSRLARARQATVAWLEAHEFPIHDLHFVRHGEKHVSLARFDVTVEDDLNQAMAFDAAGFSLNIVMAHPWNSEAQASKSLIRLASWNDVAQKLRPTI